MDMMVKEGNMNLIGKYQNGNYIVSLYENGTKIRENDLDNLTPAFAENCDVKITDKCDGGCAFCYEGCTPNGKHGDILKPKFLDTLHPYTELAINGNDLSHPDLVPFMYKMKDKNIILNMTVNQIHFERYFDTIKDWIDKKLIYGLGISLRKPTYEFIDMVKQIPNAVIHVINGIVSMPDLDTLAGNGLKILILGYKNLKRGESYYESHNESVLGLQEDLNRYLFPEIIGHSWFDVVSFDNLAIEQLHVKEHMSKEEWNSFFMGEDGDYTFYIDMVEGMFAKDSLSMERYPLMDNIDDMFNFLRNQKEK
jgi:hypothetical protein